MSSFLGRRRRLAFALGVAVAAPAAAGCQVLVGITDTFLVIDEGPDGGLGRIRFDASAPPDAGDGDSAETSAVAPDVVDAAPDRAESAAGEDSGELDSAQPDAPADALSDGPPDAAGDAPADAGSDGDDGGPPCTDGDMRCNGNTAQLCTSGEWADQTVCPDYCSQGICVTPLSCSSLTPSCGPGSARGVSCCSAHWVDGGSFQRSYDFSEPSLTGYNATVSSFVLDDFEVTLGRFAQFVEEYPEGDGGVGSKPAAGSGQNPHDGNDKGWNANWPLPADRPALENALTSCGGQAGTTWGQGDQGLPVNCVDWYVAFAFCIWDGGRLPTEAEWNYAAAGGNLQLTYPWSASFIDEEFPDADAVYYPSAIQQAGSKLPAGVGQWLQADLIGNVSEWVRDAYQEPYGDNPCNDCFHDSNSNYKVYRGADIRFSNDTSMAASQRFEQVADQASPDIGVRCARSN